MIPNKHVHEEGRGVLNDTFFGIRDFDTIASAVGLILFTFLSAVLLVSSTKVVGAFCVVGSVREECQKPPWLPVSKPKGHLSRNFAEVYVPTHVHYAYSLCRFWPVNSIFWLKETLNCLYVLPFF